MGKRTLITFSILCINIYALGQINPTDGCPTTAVLPVNTSCVNNAFSLPGSFSNGGLVTASCANNSNKDDGWFSFVATSSSIGIDETSTNRRHLISVWTACAGGTELGCDQSNSGIQNTVVLSGLTIGTTYYIQIQRRSGGNSASISGNICVYEIPIVPEDCQGGTTVCSSGSFSGNSSGGGNIVDLNSGNNGCLNSNENESSWYYFSAATDGTYVFTIVTAVDYDFAVWGPMASVTCSPVGNPIRCSYSGTSGNTGLQVGAGDNSEGSGGNKFVNEINATSGEIYILVIDNFTADGSGFDLNWTLTGGATLSCIPLPVELASFTGKDMVDHNLLRWETKSESDSKEFIIERSWDGEEFEEIGTIPAAGNSVTTLDYSFRDFDIWFAKAYYRIKMVDLDLSYEYTHLISVNRTGDDITIYPNPTNGEVNFLFDKKYLGSYTITYRDLMGRSVQERILLDGFENNYESTALENFSAGIYFVQITDGLGNVIRTEKIIKN
jgi:Secretion system C-terminal sorting domain